MTELFEDNSSTKESVAFSGLVWETSTDTLPCKVELIKNLSGPVTKRIVLTVAHQMFDYISYAAPVMLFLKMILQKHLEFKTKMG